MTHTNPPARSGPALPMTEGPAAPAITSAVDEAMIRTLVDTFYTAVRDDDVLGPVFARHVADWSAHLPKMYDFWSSIVLRTGRYAGRPLEAHRRLAELTDAHFARWLDLWERTVASVVPPAARTAFTSPAQRMAASMASVLLRN